MNGAKSMDCEKVRDQFSFLFEGELKPPEEEKVREHLAFCPNCEKEWKEFRQMMGWLHAVEEEDVPEGFLSELQKKREERKGKERRGGDRFFRSMKIPIQAAAMVMIVFLALYLSNMAPFEMLQKRAVEKPEILQSDREKKESIFKEEMATAEPLRPKEMAKAEAPPLEEKRRESERVGTVIMPFAKKTAREITLKISDRERAISRVQELAKQWGGEVVRENGDVLLASLPASSYAEFEKELAQVGSSPDAPKAAVQREMKDDL